MQSAGSHYWARFRAADGRRLRFDTRIYLQPTDRPGTDDPVIGCIIGKNPGSADPATRSRALVPLKLQGDKFLPTVLSMLRKAHRAKGVEPPANAFVQVLNLFYLCDRDLAAAKRALRAAGRPRPCATEKAAYPWAWFAWGGADPTLDPLKPRFDSLSARRCFFYDGRLRSVVQRRPAVNELAKHTQGLPQADLVRFLAENVI